MGGHPLCAQGQLSWEGTGGLVRQSVKGSRWTEQVPFLLWAAVSSSVRWEGGGWSWWPSCQWLSLSWRSGSEEGCGGRSRSDLAEAHPEGGVAGSWTRTDPVPPFRLPHG